MKPKLRCHPTISTPRLLALLAAVPLLALAEDVKLKLISSGGMAKMGGYYPLRLALSAEKPEAIKKLPADLAAPLFGTLKLGPSDAPTTIAVVLDEPDDKPSRLFVDANANGDLTDDPAPVWSARAVNGKDGVAYRQCSGSAQVTIPLGKEPAALTIAMYRFDKRDPARAAQKEYLFHYPDYAREGEITLAGKTYKALLADRRATGDFRGKEGTDSGVQLFIDANEDGKLDSRNEAFDVRQPFNIGGQTYEIAGMTPGGESFRIQKSVKTVAEKKAPVAIAAGKPATVFKAKTTDGKDVDFPASYKGKIVLLDFWATWCGPCIGELPNLTAAYQKFHGQGFEILGISLDRAGDEKKLADFTKAKNMPWPQVFDGKFWSAEVAKLYDIHSIPAAYLVDGDTGVVLASSGLRGSELEKTIAAALAKKNGK
ncbi:MAG: TlpA family protein disulfide reductase [Limisphaerales bacterium]